MTNRPMSVEERLRARFETKVQRTETCHLWIGQIGGSRGYGQFSVKASRNTSAHRVAWTIYRGPIPEGGNVLHKCRNRRCVNPDHLYIGTISDNARDSVRDGT